MSLIQQLSEFVSNQELQLSKNELSVTATRAFIDTIGVALFGTQEEVWSIANKVGPRLYSEDGNSEVWGTNKKVSPSLAAWINGIAAHAADFDDVSSPMRGHPSTVLVPTALAVAQDIGASGLAALDAYAVGFEVVSRVGELMGPQHYAKGWHPTFTIGVLGACATTCRLLGLSKEQVQRAIGIAASLSGGLRLNFGTMTKPLHAGEAAKAGIEAAYLARSGLTANHDIFSGPMGFLQIFDAEISEPLSLTPLLGNPWSLLESGIDVKKYPCCYMTHRAIDGCLNLIEKYNITPEQISSVHVETSPGEQSALIYNRPQTALEGKFSIQYTVASALFDRKITISTFTDDQVQRSEIQQFFGRVTNDQNHPELNGTRLRIVLENGRLLETTVAHPRGAPVNPLSNQELDEKFVECACYAMQMAQALQVKTRVWDLSEQRHAFVFI